MLVVKKFRKRSCRTPNSLLLMAMIHWERYFSNSEILPVHKFKSRAPLLWLSRVSIPCDSSSTSKALKVEEVTSRVWTPRDISSTYKASTYSTYLNLSKPNLTRVSGACFYVLTRRQAPQKSLILKVETCDHITLHRLLRVLGQSRVSTFSQDS